MAEQIPRPPHRIPNEEDYEIATEIVDTFFQSRNGPWAYYRKMMLLDVYNQEQSHASLMSMASQARLIEPIEDEQFAPIDPLFRSTHAFLAGMWTGRLVSSEIHKDVIGFAAINDAILNALPNRTTGSQDQYEENGRMMLAIGDEGLQRVGFAAREQVGAWGDDIVSDPDFRKYYSLGAGAILYSSHTIYSQVYEELKLSYEAATLSYEASQYLAGIYGSSDN